MQIRVYGGEKLREISFAVYSCPWEICDGRWQIAMLVKQHIEKVMCMCLIMKTKTHT